MQGSRDANGKDGRMKAKGKKAEVKMEEMKEDEEEDVETEDEIKSEDAENSEDEMEESIHTNAKKCYLLPVPRVLSNDESSDAQSEQDVEMDNDKDDMELYSEQESLKEGVSRPLFGEADSSNAASEDEAGPSNALWDECASDEDM